MSQSYRWCFHSSEWALVTWKWKWNEVTFWKQKSWNRWLKKTVFLNKILLKSIKKRCSHFIYALKPFAGGFQWCFQCSDVKSIRLQNEGVMVRVICFVSTSKKSWKYLDGEWYLTKFKIEPFCLPRQELRPKKLAQKFTSQLYRLKCRNLEPDLQNWKNVSKPGEL